MPTTPTEPPDEDLFPVTLAAALVAFQAELPAIAKDKTARVPMKEGGSYSYTYADLAALTDAAFPVLTKHGLSFTCLPTPLGSTFVLTGVLLHVSGERIEGSLPLFGNTPQQFGSALTYMRRYLLAAMTGLVPDEDTDGDASARADWSRTRPAAAEPTQQDEPWQTPVEATQDDKDAALVALMGVVSSTEPGDTRDAAIQAVWGRHGKVQRSVVTPPQPWQDDLGPGPVPWRAVVAHARTVR